jgi:hypothetical protein
MLWGVHGHPLPHASVEIGAATFVKKTRKHHVRDDRQESIPFQTKPNQ